MSTNSAHRIVHGASHEELIADQAKSKQIKDFLRWMLDPEAQRIASDLNYAPLPVSLIQLLQERVGR